MERAFGDRQPTWIAPPAVHDRPPPPSTTPLPPQGGKYAGLGLYYLSDLFHTLVNCPWWVLAAAAWPCGCWPAGAGGCWRHAPAGQYPTGGRSRLQPSLLPRLNNRYRFYLLFVFFYVTMVRGLAAGAGSRAAAAASLTHTRAETPAHATAA